MEAEIELRWCPHCKEKLPISEFGICRSRNDGLNRYCRKSINVKIAASRQALREYKNRPRTLLPPLPARKPAQAAKGVITSAMSPRRIARSLRRLGPNDRVLAAIRLGAQTQADIRRLTKLPVDQITNILAVLRFEHNAIIFAKEKGERRYLAA